MKRIEAEWYSEFAEESFGSQRVNGVQLLSMNKPKDERGYYYNSLQLDFGVCQCRNRWQSYSSLSNWHARAVDRLEQKAI